MATKFDIGGATSGAMMGGRAGSVGGPMGTAIGAVVGGGIGGFGGSLFGFGSDEEEEMEFAPPPDYYLSDYYSKSQQDLYGTLTDILAGDLPEYYKPVGEYGGLDFENLMSGITSRLTTDVGRATEEDIVRRGVSRGGLGAAATSMNVASKVGDIRSELGYADYNRALETRGNLLGIGLSGLEGVRQAGLSESQLQNAFNLDVWTGSNKLMSWQMEKESENSGVIGDIMSSLGSMDFTKMFSKTPVT